jgi:hypothetical protein
LVAGRNESEALVPLKLNLFFRKIFVKVFIPPLFSGESSLRGVRALKCSR